jgi:VWFA-related protein
MSRGVVLLLAGCLLTSARTDAQDVPGRLRIEFPTAGTLLSGPIVIRAIVGPDIADRIVSLTFSVDGTVVCGAVSPQRPECAWNAGSDIKQHVIRVVGNVTRGERLVATVRTAKLDYTETVKVDIVQLSAVVQDRDGKFVTGLPRDTFRVFENGAPQRITHFAAQESTLELVLAIDVSGSMAESIPDLKLAVSAFLQAVGPAHSVTILAFNDTMFTLASRETSPDIRVRSVARLAAWGGTALYDALSKSIDIVSGGAGRRALVLFTDGEDRSSQTSIATVREKLESTDATLFVVGLGRGATVDRLKRGMEELVEVNGGVALFAEHAKDLRAPFGKVLAELANQYLIGYESTNPARDGSWRTIKVESTDKRHRIRTRQGYRAASK